MSARRTLGSAAALALLPFLLAPKCFDPEIAPDLTPDARVRIDGEPGVDAGPEPDGPAVPAFVPAVACPEPGQARLHIVDFSYQVRCGCREVTGKTCTVPRGTRVIWQFADAEEHNVASSGTAFAPSGERLTGTFDHTFEATGTFAYECSIHTEMTGYTIVVL